MVMKLKHRGVKGIKWGIRKDKNTEVFISGTSKLSELYKIQNRRICKKKRERIIVGDAPGVDTEVQKYLSKIGYDKVTVYVVKNNICLNAGRWKEKCISAKTLNQCLKSG